MINRDIIMCPFCEETTLEILVTRRKQWSPYRGEPDKMVKSGEVLLSNECMKCHKNRDEIVEKYKTMGVNFK